MPLFYCTTRIKYAKSADDMMVLCGQLRDGNTNELKMEFPSFEEAETWYYSPAYQEAVKHRLKGAAYRGIIVEGKE
ncbi:DUF1330 domain-containing protein [Paenibacillus sp. 2RAB27]|uniref:DUF1330 domain-containing protein n=1 Tax=Paenibacillus sp. 2RAB27 TaxID=3232991 RepID=UPI003F9746E9